MSALRFQELAVKRVSPEAAGAVAITLAIPEAERERFAFEPGQFLTLRATINGQDVRRSYSISSPRSRLAKVGELEVGEPHACAAARGSNCGNSTLFSR